MKEETIEELRSKPMKKGYSVARANPKQNRDRRYYIRGNWEHCCNARFTNHP